MNMKSLLTFIIAIVINCNIFAQKNTKAIEIAHKTMETMGGVENWNNVHYIKWDFGKRTLHWDKWTGNVRVENPKQNLVVLVNINTLKGKAFKNGKTITNSKELNAFLEQAKKWWINDSYWLTMPWKLLDPGVNLTHLKTEKLPNGNAADILQLTFENVGATPENKYWIYVDQKENLVKQWAFFKNFNDEKPRFTRAWDNYQSTGNILLSFNRSQGAGGPKNVVVSKQIDDEIFTIL